MGNKWKKFAKKVRQKLTKVKISKNLYKTKEKQVRANRKIQYKKKIRRNWKKFRSRLFGVRFKKSASLVVDKIILKKRRPIMSFAKKYFLIKLSKKILFCKKKRIQFYLSSVIFKKFGRYLFNYPFYIVKRRFLRYISFFSFLKEKTFLKRFFPLKNLFLRRKKRKKLSLALKKERLQFNSQAAFNGTRYRLKNFKMLKISPCLL